MRRKFEILKPYTHNEEILTKGIIILEDDINSKKLVKMEVLKYSKEDMTYEELTIEELKEIARDREISYPPNIKQETLIEKLREADNKPAGNEGEGNGDPDKSQPPQN